MLYTRDNLRYRFLLSAIFGVVAFFTLPHVVDGIEQYWYRTTPATEFVDYVAFIPQNMCTGDTEQRVATVRRVHHTTNGWEASITEEIHRLEQDSGVWAKVVPDYRYDVFIEPTKDDAYVYVFEHEKALKPGVYRLESIVTLHLPHGIDRQLPRLTSTNFEVLNCPQLSSI